MYCFRDMTFCTFLDCGDLNCPRRLTFAVQKDADKWWKEEVGESKGNPPICTFMAKPRCFKEEHDK